MPWPKGKPRPENSGRKKGTANKETQDLHAICAKHGVNVFEAMVILAVDQEDEKEKFSMLERISKYLYPIRKAIEHSSDEKGFKIIIEDYRNKEEK